MNDTTGDGDVNDHPVRRLSLDSARPANEMWRLVRRLATPKLFGLMVAAALATIAQAAAADLPASPRKAVRIHHVRGSPVVRDYDGTPIRLVRRPDDTTDTRTAMRATPSRYLNGQRVRP